MMNNAPEVEKIDCPLCGGTHFSAWGRKDGLDIVKCVACHLIFVNPRPTPTALERYYSINYFQGGNYEEDEQRIAQYKFEMNLLLPIIGTRGRFLDVGCAMGRFLHTLPESFEKHGIEFSKDAAEFGRKRFGLNIRHGQISKLDVQKEFFDVAQMRGVVEHLQHPVDDMIAVNRALKPGGWYILSQTPNIGSWSGKIYRARHNQVFPNEHLTYFTPKTVEKMLNKAGFEVVHRFYPYLGTPYENWPKDLVNFALNYISGKDSPPFWGNMMVLVSRKTKSL